MMRFFCEQCARISVWSEIYQPIGMSDSERVAVPLVEGGLAFFHSLDVGTEHKEFLVNMLVTAVDVIKAGNFCGALGGECCENEGGGGAEVGGHDGRGG